MHHLRFASVAVLAFSAVTLVGCATSVDDEIPIDQIQNEPFEPVVPLISVRELDPSAELRQEATARCLRVRPDPLLGEAIETIDYRARDTRTEEVVSRFGPQPIEQLPLCRP